MVFFSERKTKNENIAFISIMAAVNVLLSVLSSFLPLGSLFAMLFLPLVSALTALLCKGRYVIIYAIAALGLSFAVTAYNFEGTLFYTLPSLVSGLLIGYLSKKGLPLSLLVFLTSFAYMGLVYCALPLIDFLYGLNPVTLLYQLTGIADNSLSDALTPAVIFVYSLLATGIASFVISLEFEKFKAAFAPESRVYFLFPAIAILFFGLSIIGAFYLPSLCYISLVISLYAGLMSLMPIVALKSKWVWGLFVVLLFASLFLMAGLYSSFPSETALAAFGFYFLSAAIAGMVSAIILKTREKAC